MLESSLARTGYLDSKQSLARNNWWVSSCGGSQFQGGFHDGIGSYVIMVFTLPMTRSTVLGFTFKRLAFKIGF